MEIKQHTPEQPMDQRRNQKKNQKRSCIKWKHNTAKPRRCSRSSSRREFIAINTYIKKKERSHINNLTLHFKELGKEQTKPKVNRKKEIKIRAEINETETRKIIEKIIRNKSWFFEKINKIDYPLASLTKKKRKKTQVNKIRNERGQITADTTEIQRIIRNYHMDFSGGAVLKNSPASAGDMGSSPGPIRSHMPQSN